MCLKLGNIYVWGLLVLSFMESAIPTNWYFLAFFVWSVSYSSLICKLWIQNISHCLIQKNQFQSVTTFLGNLCCSMNSMSWMSLNYKTYFRHLQKLKHYLYLPPFNLFSFNESSVLTINYVFSFFWSLKCTSLVWKLHISIRAILYFWAVLILQIFYGGIF